MTQKTKLNKTIKGIVLFVLVMYEKRATVTQRKVSMFD